MKLVIDSNILFACAIKAGATAELVFFDALELFAPEFIFEEFEEYKELLIKKSHGSTKEFDIIVSILSERVKAVPRDEFSEFFREAVLISPDPDDVLYFSLALKLGCPIWSNDKKLKEQSKVKIFSTEELLKLV